MWSKGLRIVPVVAVVGLLAAESIVYGDRYEADYDQTSDSVKDLFRDVREAIPETGVVAGTDAGALAFWTGRRVINLDGLIASTVGRLREAPVAAPKSTSPEGKTGVAPGSDASLAPSVKQPQRSVRPALEAAMKLLSAGRVQAARKQLLAIASEDGVEVAWTLARSYDPNFLDTVPGADAGPDIPEAARWYRAWHAAALKQGLVTNSVSLERIIGSMR
jgi:hypothetical protein